MSLKPLRDEVFLLLPSALQQSITTPSGVTIHLPPTLSQEEYAQVEAVVYAVGPTSELGLSPGDKVAVSYMVTNDRENNEDGETVRFNRCYDIGDDVVWKAYNHEIFAVKRQHRSDLPDESPRGYEHFEEGWVAVGEHVLLDFMYENDGTDVRERAQSVGLELPEYILKGPRCNNKGRHLSGGTLSDGGGPLPAGVQVYFMEGLGADYLFPDGKERIVTQRQYCTMYALA